MKTERLRWWRAFLLAILVNALAATGCAADSGQVIDGATGKPLADVYVIARWDGQRFAGVQSEHDCFTVESTKTNVDGRFSISAISWSFNPLLSDRKRTLIFYKSGYVEPPPAADPDYTRVVMVRDDRKDVSRLCVVGGLAGQTSAAAIWSADRLQR